MFFLSELEMRTKRQRRNSIHLRLASDADNKEAKSEK